MLNTYAIRMGAVFIISTTTIGVRTGFLPKWLAVAGFVVAIVMLFGATVSPWANLAMPVWTFAVSIDILVRRRALERPTRRAVANES